jgi:hypothetical protein
MSTKEEYLEGIACTSVDYAKTSVQSWSVEDCEYVLNKFPNLGKSMRKVFEVQARKSFALKTRGEYADPLRVKQILCGNVVALRRATYTTLRRALFLVPQKNLGADLADQIRMEIKTRFPWGNAK